jgi:putative membrane protein
MVAAEVVMARVMPWVRRAGDRPVRPEAEEADPDYRFTLANERTFLSWMRTAIGLLAGAVALVHVAANGDASTTQRSLAVVLACLGIVVCATSIRRWQNVQRAMRRGEDLPPSRQPLLLGVAIGLVGAVVVVLLLRAGGSL